LSRSLLSIDVAVAVVVAIVLIVVTPGLAITALLALLVLLVCGISLLIDRLPSRRRPARRIRSSRPPDRHGRRT
jgi:hypothetical protein